MRRLRHDSVSTLQRLIDRHAARRAELFCRASTSGELVRSTLYMRIRQSGPTSQFVNLMTLAIIEIKVDATFSSRLQLDHRKASWQAVVLHNGRRTALVSRYPKMWVKSGVKSTGVDKLR